MASIVANRKRTPNSLTASDLTFYYSAMNAGKTAHLIQSAHNYAEQDMRIAVFSTVSDQVKSRTGLQREAVHLHAGMRVQVADDVDCVFVDEAQFLRSYQVYELFELSHRIPVICYGLRTNHEGRPFEGASFLLALAHELHEIRTVCKCGRKATMNIRYDATGQRVTKGPERDLEARYASVCSCHFYAFTNNY